MSAAAYDSLATLAAFRCPIRAKLSCRALQAVPPEGWNVSLELWRRLKMRATVGAPAPEFSPNTDPGVNATFLAQHLLGFWYPPDVSVKLLRSQDEMGWSTLVVVGMGYRAIQRREAIVREVVDTLCTSDPRSVLVCHEARVGAFELTTVAQRAAQLPTQGILTVTPVLFRPADGRTDPANENEPSVSRVPASQPPRLPALIVNSAIDALRRSIVSRFEQDIELLTGSARDSMEGRTKEELAAQCRELGSLIRDELCRSETEVHRIEVAATHSHRSREKGHDRRGAKDQPIVTLRGSSNFDLSHDGVRLAVASALITGLGGRRASTAHHVWLDEPAAGLGIDLCGLEVCTS